MRGKRYKLNSPNRRERTNQNCGYAASIGKVRPANPLLWSIVDGQLMWNKDVPGNKAKADKYWPKLIEVKAGQKDAVDGLLSRSVLAEAR